MLCWLQCSSCMMACMLFVTIPQLHGWTSTAAVLFLKKINFTRLQEGVRPNTLEPPWLWVHVHQYFNFVVLSSNLDACTIHMFTTWFVYNSYYMHAIWDTFMIHLPGKKDGTTLRSLRASATPIAATSWAFGAVSTVAFTSITLTSSNSPSSLGTGNSNLRIPLM